MPPPNSLSAIATSPVPPWHTRLLLVLLVAVPTMALWVGPAAQVAAEPASPLASYGALLLVNFGLAAYVTRIGLDGFWVRPLLGTTWINARRAGGDVLSAALLASAIMGAETAWQRSGIAAESLAAHALVGGSAAAKICWPVVALAVGVSEELVYRGYLQQRLAQLSGSVPFAIVAQALLFGIAHGEQGGQAVLRFSIYALGFGAVVQLRGSLLPAVLCHVGLDLYAGLSA